MFIYRKMVFTEEDKVAIKFLRDTKRYGAKRLLAEFPAKQWSLGGLNKLLKKIDETGSIERSKGAGRPRSVRHNDNIERVEQLALSQEDKPGTHLTQREIACETGISQPTVSRILKNDLRLWCFYRAMLCISMALCPSVRLSIRLSVRPSQVRVLLKRLNVGSHKQHHTIAQGL